MRYEELAVKGAYLLEFDWLEDERGAYGRGWRQPEFAGRGLRTDFVQTNMSYTRSKGTVRGLHWQVAPHEEAKLLMCIRGAICDAIADVRPDSPTYMTAITVELSAGSRSMVYVPEGCAHGFLTLEDDSEILYSTTAQHSAQSERGMRHDDPAFAIRWPIEVTIVSPKDRGWPDFLADRLRRPS